MIDSTSDMPVTLPHGPRVEAERTEGLSVEIDWRAELAEPTPVAFVKWKADIESVAVWR